MTTTIETIGGVRIAHIRSDAILITDGQSALDLLASTFYNEDSTRVSINKEAIAEGFFVLSTGIAGEVLQKVVNYRMKLAIIGDFSAYTSKPLRDFIGESNRGNSIFFVESEQEATDRLATA